MGCECFARCEADCVCGYDWTDPEISRLRKDAERYRWLKSRSGLELRSLPRSDIWARIDGSTFIASHYLAEGGTQHAPAESLDATIDAAMSEG